MSRSWELLAEHLRIKGDVRLKKHAIVCAPNIESLKQFEARYLPTGCHFANNTLNIPGFTSTEIDDAGPNKGPVERIDLDAYAISFPLKSVALDYLKAFVNWQDANSFSWFFLLDWSMSDQRFWLSQLISSTELLDSSCANVAAGSITVCCVNADYIYTWQKNTTQWHPQHVDFIQQTLRAFCLLKKCSLLYNTTLDKSAETHELDKETFMSILAHKFDKIAVNLIAPSELQVPWGSDTTGLIKTLSDTFDPTQVLTDDFINGKFKTFIPNIMTKAAQEDEIPVEEEPVRPFKVGVQVELAKIYKEVQKRQAPCP